MSMIERLAPAQMNRAIIGFAALTLIAFGTFGCASNHSRTQAPNGFYGRSFSRSSSSNYARAAARQRQIEQEYTPLKKVPPLTDAAREKLADELMQKGHLVQAFMEYDKLLMKHPGNSRLLYKRGLIYLAKNHYAEALADFRHALQKDPGNALYHQGAGEALYRMRHFNKAQKAFRLALKTDGKLWISHDYLGIIYDHQTRFDLAEAQYQAAIALKPDWGEVYNNLGVSYCLRGDYKKAVAAFEQAIEKGYSGPQVGNNLGLALCRLGNDQEAIEAFKRSGSEAQAYNNLGVFYLMQGNYKKAVSNFETAIRLKPKFYERVSENLKEAKAALNSPTASSSVPAGKTPGQGLTAPGGLRFTR